MLVSTNPIICVQGARQIEESVVRMKANAILMQQHTLLTSNVHTLVFVPTATLMLCLFWLVSRANTFLQSEPYFSCSFLMPTCLYKAVRRVGQLRYKFSPVLNFTFTNALVITMNEPASSELVGVASPQHWMQMYHFR